jgi:Root cap
VSDSHIHVNAYYGGRYGQWGNQTHKPLTWIRKVGILWGHHNLKFEARQGAEWRYGAGYMANMEIDGETITLAQQGDSVSYSGNKIRVEYVAAKKVDGDDEVDVYKVSVGDVLSMRLTLRPEVENLRTANDGVVHFDVEFSSLDLSNNAHGVLGQTYRLDHTERL